MFGRVEIVTLTEPLRQVRGRKKERGRGRGGKNTSARSLQCRRILGGRNLVRVRNIVVAAIFDFMTVEDWGLSRANFALKENACTAG